MTSASVVAVWTLATREHGPISKQKRRWHIQELTNVFKRKNLRVGPLGIYLCKGLVDTPPLLPPHTVPVELLPLLVSSLVSSLSERPPASCRPSCKWRSRSSTPTTARRTCFDLWQRLKSLATRTLHQRKYCNIALYKKKYFTDSHSR